MLSGKDLILATKPFAREIPWKSWYYTLTSFFLLVACIYVSIVVPYVFAKIALSFCIAIMLSRFFIIFHDYQHHAILNKSFLANAIFTVFAVYMITPPSIWKRSHDHHHKNNSKLYSASIGSFPIMTKQKFLNESKNERFFYLAVRHPLNMIFAYFSMFLYGMCLQSFLSSPRRHWDSLVVIILHITIGTLLWVYFGWLTFLLTFFLPFFLSHMLGAYLFYAQHNFPGVKFRSNIEWSYSHAALESSSYLAMNRFLNWATANIGYHHVHHLNARIPFYRLPEAMASIPDLQNVTVTTLRPKDIISCLRLKIWDPDQNKMIGLNELYLAS